MKKIAILLVLSFLFLPLVVHAATLTVQYADDSVTVTQSVYEGGQANAAVYHFYVDHTGEVVSAETQDEDSTVQWLGQGSEHADQTDRDAVWHWVWNRKLLTISSVESTPIVPEVEEPDEEEPPVEPPVVPEEPEEPEEPNHPQEPDKPKEPKEKPKKSDDPKKEKPTEIIINEAEIPLGTVKAPVEIIVAVYEPPMDIVLDEEVPLGVPVLPQTGESLPFAPLLGTIISSIGIYLKRR